MRAFVATGLLLLQLRPMLGMALCRAFSGGDGDRMEIDCPMPESVDVSHHPFRAEIDEFVACVLEGRETSISVRISGARGCSSTRC